MQGCVFADAGDTVPPQHAPTRPGRQIPVRVGFRLGRIPKKKLGRDPLGSVQSN
jgi:hypothetical protein